MIWRSPVSLEALNEAVRGTLMEALGIRYTAVHDDCLVAEMPVDARTVQPAGLLHGGASVALGESTASAAAFLCVDPDTYAVVGTEVNASHLRSVTRGTVTCTARPLRIGSTSHVWTFEVVDDRGRIACTGRLAVSVLPRP